MRWLAGVVLAALVATMVAAHPPAILSPAGERAVAEEIQIFRKALAAAIVARDAGKLREMYAGSFVHTHGSGKVDGKDARIVSALAGDPVIENAPVEDLVIRAPSDWTAVATGVSPIRSLTEGKTYSFRWTAVYVRTQASWALAASQATRLAEVKP